MGQQKQIFLTSFRLMLFLCVIFLHVKFTSPSTALEEKTSAVPSVNAASTDNYTAVSNTTSNSSVITTTITPGKPVSTAYNFWYLEVCPNNIPCQNLGASCISCKLNYYCVYGKTYTAECTVKPNITCTGSLKFQRPYHCRYGYQLDPDLYLCDTSIMPSKCQMKQAPAETLTARCQVKEEVICLGDRSFYKKFPCNWTSGFKWSTALVLSITLGGFGVDRFYIGLWRSGIGKLFSFGGLGVWTIVDVVLIAVGYVGPHDGSLYIYPWN